MLRSNLEFVNLDRGARSILVTSALEQEGKSTTVSNLAVALARAGKRVALVDLDLRRPAVASSSGSTCPSGVTNVVLGQSPLDAGSRRGVPRDRGRRRRLHPALARTVTVAGEPSGRSSRGPRAPGSFRPDAGEFVELAALARAARRAVAAVRLRPDRHAPAALRRRRDDVERPRRRDDRGRAPRHAQAADLAGAFASARDMPDGQARVRRHRRRDRAGLREHRLPVLRPRVRVRRQSAGALGDDEAEGLTDGVPSKLAPRAAREPPVASRRAIAESAPGRRVRASPRAASDRASGRTRAAGAAGPCARKLMVADLLGLTVAFVLLQGCSSRRATVVGKRAAGRRAAALRRQPAPLARARARDGALRPRRGAARAHDDRRSRRRLPARDDRHLAQLRRRVT